MMQMNTSKEESTGSGYTVDLGINGTLIKAKLEKPMVKQ